MPARAYPEGHVFYRTLNRGLPLAARGEGCWIHGEDGRSWLDAVGGAFVVSLGHGNARVARAIGEQAGTLGYINGTQFTHGPVEELSAELARRAPGDLSHAYFLGSGSEAVEAALKLARQYWVESGRPEKTKVLSLAPGYHGNTMLALSASGRPRYQTFFHSWLVSVPRVPAPYPYRCECAGRSADCPVCSGAALERAIQDEGPGSVAAFIAEPVGGSSTGGSVPRPEYWRNVREICDRHGVLWIADEVLSGAGRTGTWSALEPYAAVPDILTMGKGITSGYVPLSVVLAPRRIVDVIAKGSGSLLHAQTFSHHPVACAAALATLEEIERQGLLPRVAAMGALLHERLKVLLNHEYVGDVRGRGLLAGVEFVSNTATRQAFPRTEKIAEKFAQAAFEAGLVVWPNTGHANGVDGDLAMIAPPFIVSESEIDEIVRRFQAALSRTF